jgi:hypothetical protein
VTPYRLSNFLEAFDDWTLTESPPQDVRLAVLDWIFTREETPYKGVKREAGHGNLWWGAVPETQHQGHQVVCVYWIEEGEHTVRCDSFATLSPPF